MLGMVRRLRVRWYGSLVILCALLLALQVHAQSLTAVSTTTLFISICGDSLVSDGEDCDIPSETGAYSTTITGRQCADDCFWGPYCGDAILQTLYSE